MSFPSSAMSRRHLLPALTRAAALLAATLAGCADAGEVDAPDLGSQDSGFEIRVAPLDLPGIGFACYDVAVQNGLGEPVWSRGDFGLSYPDDRTTLCSDRFGNAAGGDIAYVGPCDASAPEHTVSLVLDGLYETDGSPLTDFQSPCTASAPCAVTALCTENADTPVNFNLTVMRAAQQGFFDIAVNFDSIFCSAKVDCSYDDEGLDPINLLHNPATGQREQTAVIGFSCTAGPGAAVETTLLMNDLRIVCGEVDTFLFGGYALEACDPSGAAFYTSVFTFTPDGGNFQTAVYTRDLASGHYEASPLVWVDPDSLAPPISSDESLAPVIVGVPEDTWAIGYLVHAGQPTVPGDPFSAILAIHTAIFTRASSGDAWSLHQVLAFHPNAVRPVGLLRRVPAQEYLIAYDSLDAGLDGDDDVVHTLYLKTADPGFTYGAPVQLRRPAGYGACDYDMHMNESLIVAVCEDGLGELSTLVWRLDATPTPVGPGQGLDAAVMPLSPSDFSFVDGTDPVTVLSIDDIWPVGSVEGLGTTSDRVFITVRLALANGAESYQMVHFRRTGPSTWALEPPPFGQDALPTDGTVHYQQGTSFSHVVSRPDGDGAVVTGGLSIAGSWRRIAAIYDRVADTWEVFTDFVYAASPTSVPLYIENMNITFTDSAGRVHVGGEGRDWADPPELRRAFVGPLVSGEIQQVMDFLPTPDGYTLIAVEGMRGPTGAAPYRITATALNPAGDLEAIEWRLGESDAGLTLDAWYVYTPDEALDGDLADSMSLRDNARDRARADARLDAASQRCPQVLEMYESEASGGGVWMDGERAIVFDPELDLDDSLAAVTSVTPVSAAGFDLDGTRIVRAPLSEPPDTFLPALPEAGDAFVLSPAASAEGNYWSPANPVPADLAGAIWQAASWHGAEALECGGAPCNKVYWNTAIGFNPALADCELRFEATAANSASLVDGNLPPNTSWPVLVGRVPLTSAVEGDADPEVLCRRHPLGSEGLGTRYLPQGEDLAMCYALTVPGGEALMSELGCGYTAEDYAELDAFFSWGGAGQGGFGGDD